MSSSRFLSAPVVVLLLVGVAGGVCRADDDRPQFLVGPEFHRQFDRPITVARDDVELRDLLRRLGETQRIAILLDRRIDPNQEIDVQLPLMTFRDALAAIAQQVEAEVSIVGSTVYLGPPHAAQDLRTLIALRELELAPFSEQLGRRNFELSRRHTIDWLDLDRPRDLLPRLAAAASLTVMDTQLVPHDLWAGATLAEVNVVEALSLVLIQFDLTFNWTGVAEGIEPTPVPRIVALEKTHTVSGISPQNARQRIAEAFPDLELRIAGRELTATTTIERHEAIAVLARGGSLGQPAPQNFGPLKNRRFTMRLVRERLGDVLATLTANGLDVRYDAEQLKAGGVDPYEKLSFDLKQATIRELLDAICEPFPMTYRIEGEVITLSAE